MRANATLQQDFTQTDPLQADVGQPYPSTYVYANNNPNVYTDPSGMRGVLGQGLFDRFGGGIGGWAVPKPATKILGKIARAALGPLAANLVSGPEFAEPNANALLTDLDWPLNEKYAPESATRRKLGGKRVVFRGSNNNARALTPRPHKDLAGYPQNGLSSHTHPESKCAERCLILSVDVLLTRLALSPELRKPAHVYIQGLTAEDHQDWAESFDKNAENDDRSKTVLSSVLGVYIHRLKVQQN
jgi:hypothetical protein